jgi:hypothetical protein
MATPERRFLGPLITQTCEALEWFPFGAYDYVASPPSLDDHPPDIEGFPQIRDDDTEINQFPQVPGKDIESITQFLDNPSVSPANEVDATGSHAPPTLEQAFDNVPSIVADIVGAALDSIQPPEQHERVAAACTELVQFITNLLQENW